MHVAHGEKRGDTECTIFSKLVVAAPELLRCLHNLAPQAEERRGETRGGGGHLTARSGSRTSHHTLNSVVVCLKNQLNHGHTRIQLSPTKRALANMSKVRQSSVAMG